jgi:hypothetical protein
MTFPFEFLSTTSREAGLVAGLFIGIAFGFVLERSGFGRADKLAAQFYLRDMTVFKVMFTAIVTAMLGLVAASSLGLADLRAISESIASWTWIWPMLVGGIVLGIGFIISGYCPGTSIVAAASGNVDGMVTVAGVVAGTTFYTSLLRIPAFAAFHESGSRQAWFLYDLVNVPPAVIAIVFAAMAVLAFIGAEKVESLIAHGTPRRQWRVTVPAFATIAAIAVIALAALPPRAAAAGAKPPSITTDALAPRVIAEPWRYRIEEGVVTDAQTNRTYAIAGGAEAWKKEPLMAAATSGRPASATPRPAATFAKPKKKGGGCSS